jgi:photosystem II stability/assembly factor-like uncharacterized protein
MKKLLLLYTLFVFISCHKDQGSPSQKFERLNTNTTETLTDASFINKNQGIASGSFGYLAKTNDGGKTWEKLNAGVNHSFMSAYMLDEQNFYTARVGIYKTADAGQHFTECADLSDYSNSIFGIHFYNTQVGLLVKGNIILKTTDSGNNWVIKYDEGAYLSHLQIASAKVGYVSGGITYDGVSSGEMHKTEDAGETWKAILQTSSEITTMYFINDNIGYYANIAREWHKTTDGGKSWSKKADLLYVPLSACFTDEHNGYYTTYEGKILKTINGGLNWTVIYEETNEPIVKIISTQQTIYAVGNNGLFLKKN